MFECKVLFLSGKKIMRQPKHSWERARQLTTATLIRIVDIDAVIDPVGYFIAVDVVVALVADAVVVNIVLSRIHHVRTIVSVILDTIFVAIQVVVASIPDAVAIGIRLVRIANMRTVVARVADAVPVDVTLTRILYLDTVVPCVEYTWTTSLYQRSPFARRLIIIQVTIIL